MGIYRAAVVGSTDGNTSDRLPQVRPLRLLTNRIQLAAGWPRKASIRLHVDPTGSLAPPLFFLEVSLM